MCNPDRYSLSVIAIYAHLSIAVSKLNLVVNRLAADLAVHNGVLASSIFRIKFHPNGFTAIRTLEFKIFSRHAETVGQKTHGLKPADSIIRDFFCIFLVKFLPRDILPWIEETND